LNSTPLIAFIYPILKEDLGLIKFSLGSILNQTFDDYEVIIISESPNILIKNYLNNLTLNNSKIKVLTPSFKRGLASALNLGILFSKAKYIARADADDFQIKDRLTVQFDFLERHPEIDVLGSSVNIVDREFKFLRFKRYPETHESIHRISTIISPLCHPSVMFRRSVIEKYGMYDESYEAAEDYELWLRWIKSGVKFHNLPFALVNYSVSDISRRSRKHWKYNFKAKLKHFSLTYPLRRLLGIFIVLFLYLSPQILLSFLYSYYTKAILTFNDKEII